MGSQTSSNVTMGASDTSNLDPKNDDQQKKIEINASLNEVFSNLRAGHSELTPIVRDIIDIQRQCSKPGIFYLLNSNREKCINSQLKFWENIYFYRFR